jgi:DNA-binding transcriptional regulator YhcF (GntR family)
MKKIILMKEEGSVLYETYEDMFRELSEQGIVVSEIIDGTIKTADKKEMTFGVIAVEGTSDKMKEEVTGYRDSLRESVGALIKQGISIPKAELNKLAKQFEFLGEKKEEKKSVQKKVDKKEEDDIPV